MCERSAPHQQAQSLDGGSHSSSVGATLLALTSSRLESELQGRSTTESGRRCAPAHWVMTRTSSHAWAASQRQGVLQGHKGSDRRGADAPGQPRERSQKAGRATNIDIVSCERSLPAWLGSGSRALVCVSINVATRTCAIADSITQRLVGQIAACSVPRAVFGRGPQRRRARRRPLPGVDTPRRRTPAAPSQRQELAAGAPTPRFRATPAGCEWRNKQPAFTTPCLSEPHTLSRIVLVSGAFQRTRNVRQRGSTCLSVGAPAAYPSRTHHYLPNEAGVAQPMTIKQRDAEICSGRRVRADAHSDWRGDASAHAHPAGRSDSRKRKGVHRTSG
jgi:hypothetical protein